MFILSQILSHKKDEKNRTASIYMSIYDTAVDVTN